MYIGVMPSNMYKLIVNDNNSKSGSAVSLLSAEAEQALLKVSFIWNMTGDTHSHYSNKRNI